ncbi:MAG: hypothetical protein EOO20_05440 [Chryseobacterium sp.]|nr:MAG: hypothetical protein EOO20_05440 [Chryseobacterium sp.]
MIDTRLKYYTSGQQALEAIQITFPQSWKQEVSAAQRVIRILKNFYQTDTNTAIDKYTDHAKDDAKRLLILAAGYLMHRAEALANAIDCLDDKMSIVDAELLKLKNTNWSPRNQATLADYYSRSLRKYGHRMELAIAAVPVIPKVPLTYTSQIL